MSDETESETTPVTEVLQTGVQIRRAAPKLSTPTSLATNATPEVDGDADDDDDDDTTTDTPDPPPRQPVTKRKQRASTINDLPRDELKSLQDSGVDQIGVRVSRRTPNGAISAIFNGPFEIRALFNGEFETFLHGHSGGSGTGGYYEIDVYDLNDPTSNLAVPRWKFQVPGQPRDPKFNVPGATPMGMQAGGYHNPGMPLPGMLQPGVGMAQGAGGIHVPSIAYQVAGVATPQQLGPGQVTAPPQDQLPPWARAYPVHEQWPLYYQQLQRTGRLPAGASMHSDALASGHAQSWQIQHSAERAENAKLREKLEATERLSREREEKFQKAVEEMRAERDREKYEGQIAALHAKIDSMGNRSATPEWLGQLATIAAPALAAGLPAFIGYLGESRRTEADRHLRTMELTQNQQQANQTNMLALVKRDPPTTDWPKLLAALGPLVIPVVTQMMTQNSPQAQAELADMNHQSKLMMMKMMSDMIIQQAEMANPDEPSWMPAVRSILEAVGGLGQGPIGAAIQRKLSNGQRQIPPQAGPQAQAQAQAQAQEDEVWQQLADTNKDAAALTKMVLDTIPPSAGFHTHEWRMLIFNIHAKVDPADLAPKLADHLAHSAEYAMLPEVLANVFSEPEAALTPVIMGLPIARTDLGGDEGYAKRLLAATVEAVLALTEPATEEDIADTIDVASEDVVTNAAAGKELVPVDKTAVA